MKVGGMERHEIFPFLGAVSLFAETSPAAMEQIADVFVPVLVETGETFIRKGEAGDCMYILARGRIRIHDGEVTFNHLGAGEVVGEMALLDEVPRMASVTAAESSRLLRLDREAFYRLLETQPEVARGVIRVLSRRLRGMAREKVRDFEYMQQMDSLVAAAAALEAGVFDSRSLDAVCGREDELGRLGRVFTRMAEEIRTREERLKAEVRGLRIQIDEARKNRTVEEITESDYFQQLQKKVTVMRKKKKGK
jgi:CRP/FNR family cyclic AMP-dependent transcriptional regulator